MTYRSKKLLEAARNRPCVLCGAVGTTIAAHSNSLEHGRGIGHKAPDYMAAYLCQICHDLADGRAGQLSKAEKRDMWFRAWTRTVAIWFTEEIVVVNNKT